LIQSLFFYATNAQIIFNLFDLYNKF